MTTYEGTIKFTTDRPLTEDELGLLEMTLFVMLDEPVDEMGDDADWKCLPREDEPRSSSAEVRIKEVAIR